SQQQQLRHKVEECKNIIQFKPNRQKYHDFNSARAEPNQRLVKVFGIDNSFTSTDRGRRSEFIRGTISKMKAVTELERGCPGGNWQNMRRLAISSFEEYLKQAGETMHVAELVQFVTLKVSLCYLFDDAEHATADGGFENVKYIGKKINELWISSKKDEHQRPIWRDETRLHEALVAVTTVSAPPDIHIPGAFQSVSAQEKDIIVDPLTPRLNPMNVLLPAYETMWRVVMRCVLEVQYRNNERSAEWKSVLKTYLDALEDVHAMDKGVFWNTSENGVSMIDIVKETLRLYPPSRRIYRVFDGISMSADIETCQRSALLRLDFPLVFQPERWQAICPELRARVFAGEKGAKGLLKAGEEALGFMPFAFVCAADRRETRGFGMKLIALLAAVLSDGLGEEWVLRDKRELPDIGVPLNTDREAYEELQL
ncbi:hypothetical protein K504DRAFT_335966, partial [Pleomassaria siparia CBS 279.74]